MLFVAKNRGFQLIISNGAHRFVTMPNGTSQSEEIEPMLVATFNEDGYLTPRERLAAKKQFLSWGEGALGALPHLEGGVLSAADGGQSFAPSDPAYRVSTFRTDALPDRVRETYEKRLLSKECGLGTDYILVEAAGLEKPWPSYAETHHNEVAGMVEKLGLDASLVLEYERFTKNRPSVVEKLEALGKAQAELAFEHRDVEVTI